MPARQTEALPFMAQGLWCALPHLQRNLFRAPNQPTALLHHTVRLFHGRRNPRVVNMAKVAFLGLGVMGFPMAGHLVKKGGHEVTVFNRTPAKAKTWAEKFGGKTAADAESRRRRPGFCHGLRRQRQRPARGHAWRRRRIRRHEERRDLRRSHHGIGRSRPRTRRGSDQSAASNSSMPRCRAARPARKTAC